ncbi:ABC transporter ATP-binding protein [Bacillus sp. RG28]|uniref:ABC transporter ATP-binding protein n=1 Tax=Gottfriedia endophytica TaxID=2820819 RepID=A0A940NIT4_9BACI|nr:ABC transporter ATP-binding protein [Gottfriedia endophytica]MBP0726144.1 ABC transporter ATP-binding protein [Gottfriedia endophytica]
MVRILKYVFKHKSMLLIGSISMLIVIGVDHLIPYLQKLIVDDGIKNGNSSIIVPIIIGILGITLLKAVLGYVKEYLYDYIGAKVHQDLKNELFHHIQKFEFKYFDGMNTGELMSRIGEDIENIWQTIGFGLRLFVENIIYFVVSTIILFFLDWKLASICLAIMIPIGFMAVRMNRQLGKGYGNISDQTAEINSAAQQNIAGVRLVKAFAREKHETLKFLKMNRAYYDLNMAQAKTIRTYFPQIELLTNISLVAMIIVGGYFVLKNEISLGTLVAFSGYIWNLIWPMRNLGWLTDLLSRNQASSKKIFDILDRKTEIFSKSDAYSPDGIEGDIEYKNVTFSYNDEVVLRNINLTIPSGSKVALMGTTGAGKSSLLHMIGRYYDVKEGEVKVDGVNVKDFHLKKLRQNMSLVSQDTFLFSDTIENNIKFGNTEATMDEVREACRIACCLDFIENLEDGFKTEIGERGIGLSGGQKQRISIARALLRKAPILILDDATSALDMETEYELLKNLNNRFSDSTMFIIAHRISAVKNADMILYVEDGEIVEQGTHQQLLQLKGKYFDVYQEQFKDFETVESGVI